MNSTEDYEDPPAAGSKLPAPLDLGGELVPPRDWLSAKVAAAAARSLYEVRADNGLGGRVVGRDAADELAAQLTGRADVVTVTCERVGSDGRTDSQARYDIFPDGKIDTRGQ